MKVFGKSEGLASPPALNKTDPKFVPPASSKPVISYKTMVGRYACLFNRTKVTFSRRDSFSIPRES